MSDARITRVRPADENNQVLSVEGGEGLYRRSPCGGCPWRVDQTGEFPAEAFAHSADTAMDMSGRTFGCHESGAEHPAICAGFLLRGADHNMAVRMKLASGEIDMDKVRDHGIELHPGYRTMATENGMDWDDPVLCRIRHSRDEADLYGYDGGA